MSIDKSDFKSIDKSSDDDEGALSLSDTKGFMQNRSQSLQSASATIVHHQQHQSHSMSHQSSTTTMSEKSYHKTTSSTMLSATGTKAKFQSFLQHPEPSVGSSYLSVGQQTSQQKFHRQFVRSASAHSTEGGQAGAITASSKSIKTLRSASQQMEDEQSEQHLKIQQASSVLISKSAENLETKVQFGQANRSQLTLSGGFLAPPNRKLTILSPVHSAPGLHEYLLKTKGRSPISPKIQFPGSDYDPFM